MARINIEDSIYKDLRFVSLCMKVGSLDAAIGALVRAWTLAQRWYLTPERMVPVSEWEKQGISNALIDVGLAEKIDQKIRVMGADEQFGWLRGCQEAGKVSAANRLKKSTKVRSTHVEGPSTSSSFSFSKKEELHMSSGDDALPILVRIWNEHRGTLPQAKAVSPGRRRQALARWKQKPDEAYWVSIVKQISGSQFCNGDSSTGWRADVDFFLRPDTHIKTIEGKYDNRISTRRSELPTGTVGKPMERIDRTQTQCADQADPVPEHAGDLFAGS